MMLNATMTLLELQPASAGTGIVTTRLCEHFYYFSLLRCRVIHDIGWCSTASKLIGHEPHRAIDVLEEFLITFTEIVKTRFSIRCVDKTILGAFTITDEAYFTLSAVFRQCIVLITAELSLLSGAG